MLKTTIVTITTTLTAVTLAGHLFLNPVLGMFGLAATSVETLTKLQASQKIVDTMKARHTGKQNRVTNRFVKRSGKRGASTALAAATVGTVAVAAVMTSMENPITATRKELCRRMPTCSMEPMSSTTSSSA